jgi:phosphoribosylaminoimidazole synthetase
VVVFCFSFLAAGDVLIAIPSSGVHSNGYSLVRKCVEKSGLKYSDPVPFASRAGVTLGEALLVPTRIYVRMLLPLLQHDLVKGMAHITGGGITDNLPRVLPDSVSAIIQLSKAGYQYDLPPVFQWLQEVGQLKEEEMLRTFNCGIGMLVVVSAADCDEVMALLRQTNEEEGRGMEHDEQTIRPPFVIGHLVERVDVDGPRVIYEGTLW